MEEERRGVQVALRPEVKFYFRRAKVAEGGVESPASLAKRSEMNAPPCL